MIRHAFLAVLGLGSLAHADRPRYLPDGSVRLGTQTFATAQDYFRSDAFRAQGRCGSEPEPEPAGFAPLVAPTDCAMNKTLINADYDDNRVLVIQVVFHVIKQVDGVGDIAPELIRSQIEILNEDFNAIANTPGAAGANAKVKFVLARFDPQGQPTTGIEVVTSDAYFADPGSGGSNPMKTALNWDPTRYLNIYTNDAHGLLGYATFPQQSAGTSRDGVVVLWNSVGRNAPIGPPYNQGRTLTHEVGHYLGLLHTFQGGCGTTTAPYTSGDLISDTVREQTASYGCTPEASACGGGQLNPIENYMDYSDDACMTRFTTEQSNRLRCAIVNYRTVNTEPKAAFTATAAELNATFTNTSSDIETPAQLRYTWSFGDGQTSTETNPVHAYATGGSYEVTLEVVDPGSGASTMKQMVTVEAPPQPGNDAGVDPEDPDGNGGSGGGGCCDADGGAGSSAALALPLLIVLRRRRRR